MVDLALRFAGSLAIGAGMLGAVTAALWQVFKWVSAKWIEDRFARELEAFKHQQAQEIERLRGQIAASLDRVTKLHQAEFEALPRVWELAGKAYGAAASMISALQSYSNVKWLTPDELTAAMSADFFSDSDRQTVGNLQGQERQNKFQEIVDQYKWRESENLWIEFNNSLVVSGIFIEPKLREEFRIFSNDLIGAVDEFRHEKFEHTDGPKRFSDIRRTFKGVSEKMETIQSLVSDRLWKDLTPSGA